MSREIRAHLELEAEERVADGASPEEARYAARRAFGSVTLIREDARAVWIPPWVEHAGQDLRYAARRLRRAPGFAFSAVLILILGIGLNLGFFQLLNVMALRPWPVADLDSLVRFNRVTKRFDSNGFPYPATQFIRRHNAVLSAVLTSSASDVVWGSDLNDRLDALYVSANWFSELGYGAAHGRVFVESLDEQGDAPPVVVVSHQLWRTRMNGEPVAGRTVLVNDRAATVIGVAPEGFPGLRLGDIQVWLPIHQIDYFNPGIAFKDEWGSHNTQFYARLRAGVSPGAARRGLEPALKELARIRPAEFDEDESLVPYSGRDRFRGPRDRAELRTSALLIGSLMLTVLLVACANLSSLVLSHALTRVRELSVRTALGASRWRVLRQELLESTLLASVGSIGGLLAGYWAARFAATYVSLPASADLTPDWRTVAAAGASASIAIVAIGLVPAWVVGRRDLTKALRDGGQQATHGLARARFRLVLIASQVAGCCVLLLVAGSMIRGLQRMLTTDLGFEFGQLAVLDASLPRYGINGEAARAYWTNVKGALEIIPEVESVALASQSPLGRSGSRSFYNDAPGLSISSLAVDSSFFAVLRIPIIAGRTFESTDAQSGAVIISRRLAMQMYGSLDVIGRNFPKSGDKETIVGISADAPLANVTATNVAERYISVDRSDYARLILLARARNDPERLLIPLRDVARTADPRVLPRTSLPSAVFEEQMQGRRVASLIAILTGLLALGLACFGIFALIAQSVAIRTKEIGIRRALGADGTSVVCLLLRQLAIPVSLGTLAGTMAGITAGRVLEGDPFFLPSTDVLTPAVALALFALTATSAALVPALRALGAEPLRALRHE